MNRSVTQGILRGFTHGLLTATSLLANAPQAHAALEAWRRLDVQRAAGSLPSAAARARLREPARPFELGIHLNLTQGRPLRHTYPPELLDDAGCFRGIGTLFRALYRRRTPFEAPLRAELAAQIEFLVDHGFQPTHVNGHQYVEMLPGLRKTLRALVARYGIETLRIAREERLRETTLANGLQIRNWCLAHVKHFYAGRLLKDARHWNVSFPDAFFGTSHAGRIDLPLVHRFLASGTPPRLIEIGLHPALAPDGGDEHAAGWHDPLARHRPLELDLLTSAPLVDLLHSRSASLGRLAGPAKAATARVA